MTTGNAVSRYTAERREDTTAATDPSLTITEAMAAVDVHEDEETLPNALEDDIDDDILTYSLSGLDAKYFVIVGSVEHPASYDPDGTGGVDGITDEGSLIFKWDEDDPMPLDFETKKKYTVTITATDPGDDSDRVTVTVYITDVNEEPDWVIGTSPTMVVYAENGTAAVSTYRAKDPEGAGIIYSFVDDAGDFDAVDPADIADNGRFSINSLDGTLSFKSSPNYEKPGDDLANLDNRYKIAVSATVVDNPPLTNDQGVETPHVKAREVTVVVTNVNEAPAFSETTDNLEITENPDDPEKEATSTRGPLYLLNRGVGKPSAALPAAPDLDVGIPVAAHDDDSTADFPIGGYGTAEDTRDRVDGLTYTLSGTDATHFHIVPATGQILTLEKLDYEAKNEYDVTVKATDPYGLYGTIDMTIEVIDVDEVPITPNLVLAGPDSASYAEDRSDAVGTYNLTGDEGNPVTWSRGGADMSHFTLTGTGLTRTLQFARARDYETPADADGDNEYMVTVSAEAGGDTQTVEVTVTVTNAEEPGTVTLNPARPIVGTEITATLADEDIVDGTIAWVWATADAMAGNYTTVSTANAVTTSYTPVAADVGMYLRATATYNDGFKTSNVAMAVSASAVSQTAVNAAPSFPNATATRDHR